MSCHWQGFGCVALVLQSMHADKHLYLCTRCLVSKYLMLLHVPFVRRSCMQRVVCPYWMHRIGMTADLRIDDALKPRVVHVLYMVVDGSLPS